MLHQFSVKDPDGIEYFLRELRNEQGEDVADEVAGKFFKYCEYLTIQIDTDTMTARVVSTNE